MLRRKQSSCPTTIFGLNEIIKEEKLEYMKYNCLILLMCYYKNNSDKTVLTLIAQLIALGMAFSSLMHLVACPLPMAELVPASEILDVLYI